MEVNAGVVSRNTLASLRCSFCDNYLTVPPISITSMKGDRYKCGRCSFVKTEVNVPALMFETIATTLNFPCIFPNCDSEIPWNMVTWHEDTCYYQPMNCSCGQTVELQDAYTHFLDNHPGIVYEHKAIVENPGFSELHTRLITKEFVPFLVYILCDRKTDIKVGVFVLQDTAEKYEFKLDVWTHSNTATVSIPSKKVVKYEARLHCADCLLRTCPVVYHKYQSEENYPVADMTSARVNTASVFKVLGCEDFVLSISVMEQNGPAHLQAAYVRNDRLRRSWKCLICRDYLVPPIYLCPTGHSLCEGCRRRIAECPYCMMVIRESRNFALEEMAEHVQLTCLYELVGCSFTGNVDQLARHERECEKSKAGPSRKSCTDD